MQKSNTWWKELHQDLINEFLIGNFPQSNGSLLCKNGQKNKKIKNIISYYEHMHIFIIIINTFHGKYHKIVCVLFYFYTFEE